jgi:error-prone DNA polymerase
VARGNPTHHPYGLFSVRSHISLVGFPGQFAGRSGRWVTRNWRSPAISAFCGASHPGEFVQQAAELGLSGLGIADRNSFAGVVRGHVVMREVHNPAVRYVAGTRLVFSDSTPEVIAYPTDLAAYGRLCALLTNGNRRAIKGDCKLYFADIEAYSEGVLFVVLADNEPFSADEFVLRKLHSIAPGRVWLAASCQFLGEDRRRLNFLAHIAELVGVPMLAVNDAIYHHPDRRSLQDVVTCIREHLTILRRAVGCKSTPSAT